MKDRGATARMEGEAVPFFAASTFMKSALGSLHKHGEKSMRQTAFRPRPGTPRTTWASTQNTAATYTVEWPRHQLVIFEAGVYGIADSRQHETAVKGLASRLDEWRL